MPIDALFNSSLFSYETMFGFLFTLARISGVFVFLPLGPFRSGPDVARILAALGMTVAIFPQWHVQAGLDASLSRIFSGIAQETALGLAVGLTVGLVLELFQIAAQMVSLQAGLAFASTVDPTSGADSTVLLTTAQIFASLLFFASGADRLLVRALADSFQLLPPESFSITHKWTETITHLSGTIFGTGLRLAAPVIILLLLIDIVLAVLGRIQTQLPLVTISLPVKLAAAFLLLTLTMTIQPRFFESAMTAALRTLEGLFRSSR
jgi:flagellar biosynthetic protein FliR